ncbi:MAG TPA: hypothetical protein VG167_14990 [Verrucomicrobiae bacterium]|nr:hypothetical protein [Verrucomicrobiae bacterium]
MPQPNPYDVIVPMVTGIPTRVKASGIIVITANNVSGTFVFYGSDHKQTRVALTVTNMDAANAIYLATLAGAVWAVIYPQRAFTLVCSDDFQILNPNGVNVNACVAEQYPDTGNLHTNWPVFGVPARSAAAPGAGGGGGAVSGGGGTAGASPSGALTTPHTGASRGSGQVR